MCSSTGKQCLEQNQEGRKLQAAYTLMYLQMLDSLAGLLSVHCRHTAGVPAACQADMLSRQAIPEKASCKSQQGVTVVTG